MNTLQIAYKILYSLEYENKADYMGRLISPEKLGVTPDKWFEVLTSLIDEGYITGARVYTDIIGEKHVDIKNIKITLKGAEYLSENSAMKKLARVATDIIDIVKP